MSKLKMIWWVLTRYKNGDWLIVRAKREVLPFTLYFGNIEVIYHKEPTK